MGDFKSFFIRAAIKWNRIDRITKSLSRYLPLPHTLFEHLQPLAAIYSPVTQLTSRQNVSS